MKHLPRFSMASTVAGVLLALSLLFPIASELQAAPASPGGQAYELCQPNGLKIPGRVYGDDLYLRVATQDNYTVIQGLDGTWRYATLSADGQTLVATEFAVGSVNPEMIGLVPGIDVSQNRRMEIIQQKFNEQMLPMGSFARFKANKIADMEAAGADSAVVAKQKAELIKTYGAAGIPVPPGTSGTVMIPDSTTPGYGPYVKKDLPQTVQGLVVAIQFSNDNDPVPDTDLAIFNGTSISSVRGYFRYQSGEITQKYTNPDRTEIHGTAKLDLIQQFIHIKLPSPRSYYRYQPDDVQLLKDITARISSIPSNLTILSDSTVAGLTIIYAGDNMETGALWPHAGRAPDNTYVLNDTTGVRIGDYALCSLKTSDGIALGPICHEIAHALLGFGDYYDYGAPALYKNGDNIESGGVGVYCLMSYGCVMVPGRHIFQLQPRRNTTDDANFAAAPAGINPYLKLKAGWVTEKVLYTTRQTDLTFSVIQPDRYVRRNPLKPQEYYIFEHFNRNTPGYTGYANVATNTLPPYNLKKDQGSSRSGGLAIWHVDETVTTRNEYQQMTKDSHFELRFVQAAGRGGIEKYLSSQLDATSGNLGASDDFFSSDNNRTGHSDEFVASDARSIEKTPNASLFWDGSPTGVNFTTFSQTGPSCDVALAAMPVEPPQNVRASKNYTDSILIEWDYNYNYSPYYFYDATTIYFRVYRAVSTTGERVAITPWTQGMLSFADYDVNNNLVVNRDYYYIVQAALNYTESSGALANPSNIVITTGRRVIAAPPAPTVTSSANALVVTWPTPPAGSTYLLYRTTDINDPGTLVYQGTGTSYTDLARVSGTPNGTIDIGVDYYYRLCSTANGVTSAFSDWRQGYVRLGAPLLLMQPGNAMGCSLYWEHVTKSKYFSVMRALSDNPADSVILVPAGGTGDWQLLQTNNFQDAYMDITGDIGVRYVYYVRIADNPAGNDPSNWSNGATGYKMLPAPVNVRVSTNIEEGILITWDPIPGADPTKPLYYEVIRYDNKNFNGIVITGQDMIPDRTFLDTTALPGVKYTYRVVGSYSVGGGIKSVKSDPAVQGGRPLAAPVVSATRQYYDHIDVSWTAVPNATQYFVSRQSVDNPLDSVLVYSGKALTFRDENRPIGYKYNYILKAQYERDEEYSSNLSAPGTGAMRIMPPTDVTAGTPVQNGILIQWNIPEEILPSDTTIRYGLFRSATAGGPYALVDTWKRNSLETLDMGANHYYYVVKASRYAADDDFASVASAEVEGWAALAPLPAVRATSGEKQQIPVEWDITAGYTQYMVFRADVNNPQKAKPVSDWISGTSFIDDTVIPGETYFYFSSGRADANTKQSTALQSSGVVANAKLQYQLTVHNGTGSGYYDVGEVVPVTATLDNEHYFVRWDGDTEILTDTTASTTATILAAQAYSISAVLGEYPSIATLTVSPTTVAAAGTVVAKLTFSKPITTTANITVPLLYNPAVFSTTVSNFVFASGVTTASITLTALNVAAPQVTDVSVAEQGVTDSYHVSAQSVPVTVSPRGTSNKYAITNAVASVKEGEMWIVGITGPEDQDNVRELEFSLAGLDMFNYKVLDATPSANGKFRIAANTVCSTGIRVYIINNDIADNARTLKLKLLQSYRANTPDNLIDANKKQAQATIIDAATGNVGNIIVTWSETLTTDEVAPDAQPGTITVIGDDARTATLNDTIITIPSVTDAPYGGTTIITYVNSAGISQQVSISYGPRLGFKEEYDIVATMLAVKGITAFNSKPKFSLSTWDPYNVKAKKPKKAVSKVTGWSEGTDAVTMNEALKIRLYDLKALKQARQTNKFYADVQSTIALPDGLPADLLLTYNNKQSKIKVVNANVGTIILSAPTCTDTSRTVVATGDMIRLLNIDHFGSAPKAFLEYSTGSAVKTKKLKMEVDGRYANVMVTAKPKGAADKCYLIIDTGIGLLAIPYDYTL